MTRRLKVTETYAAQEIRVRALCDRLGLRLDKSAQGFRIVVEGAIGNGDYSSSLDEVDRMVAQHIEAEKLSETRISSEFSKRKRK